jgi:hypothetical protein
MRINSKVFFLLSCTLWANILLGQELVDVLDETLVVNSSTSITGYTRNKATAEMPNKVTGFIYRISVFPKGEASAGNSLLDLLQEVGAPNIKIGASLVQFAIKNNDGESVDAFIFGSSNDMQNFFNKNDGYWSYCKSMPNRSSSCFSTRECMGRKVYFGFRNNNISQGLEVRLEVVAIVDESAETDTNHSYTIMNTSGRQLKYYVSADNVKWESITLENGYEQTYSYERNEIYFKIYTDTNNFVAYKLEGDERYKIIWNSSKGKWDLVKY